MKEKRAKLRGGMRRSVAIIGAGFSGSLTAINLALNPSSKFLVDIYLIDPRRCFGPGLAYSPPSERFKLNVRAKDMGALPDDVEGFYRWMKERHPNTSPDDFVPRPQYGAYLSDLLNKTIARAHGNVIHRVSDEVIHLTRESASERWILTLKSGSKIAVNACVLAIGNLMPSSSPSAETTNGFRQPFDPRSYDNLSSCESIFILGTGLTAVDVVLECEGRGFKGNYTLLSRHGRLPRPHEKLPTSTVAHLPADWDTRGSLRALVKAIGAESRRLGSSQPVFEAMRPRIQSMWRHFSLPERRRFLRHVRPVWEVHRHRIPAEHAEVLARLEAAQRLKVIAGRLLAFADNSPPISVTIRKRGERGPTTMRACFDVAFRCTGPEGDITKSDSPLLRTLLSQSVIQPGPLGLSPILTNDSPPSLWLIGPLQRENLWEITAAREIRQQAHAVATEIRDALVNAATT
jgi:uncharacterized NAD(P)/FAD-binding protein YdhS